ncbi:MAG: histidine triad nucleotide-binding protein [Clostridia bacterium]|nr:histidine triad nucleotide-binding protein [Clostridia bacterium]
MLDDECIFCKIIKGEIPSSKVYEDDYVLAFNDINPVAPVHVLIIPKTHIVSANEITEENSEYMKKIYEAIPKIAKEAGVFEDGYRIVNNCGENGGQEVKHIHFHLIGGMKLGLKIV